MKVGDLIKDKMSEQVGIIVAVKMGIIHAFTEEPEPYYRCLIGDDYIWLFGRHFEAINESR